jgi:hypothetical protein
VEAQKEGIVEEEQIGKEVEEKTREEESAIIASEGDGIESPRLRPLTTGF